MRLIKFVVALSLFFASLFSTSIIYADPEIITGSFDENKPAIIVDSKEFVITASLSARELANQSDTDELTIEEIQVDVNETDYFLCYNKKVILIGEEPNEVVLNPDDIIFSKIVKAINDLSPGEFIYNNQLYQVGFGNYSSGQALHIDDGIRFTLDEEIFVNENPTITCQLMVAKKSDDHNITGSASQVEYNSILNNLTVYQTNSESETVTGVASSYDDVTLGEINTKEYTVNVPKSIGNNTVKIVFNDLNNDQKEIYFDLTIQGNRVETINVDDLQLTKIDENIYDLSKLNSILSSKQNIEDFLKTEYLIESIEPNAGIDLIFKFNENYTYVGTLNVNTESSLDDIKIAFVSNDDSGVEFGFIDEQNKMIMLTQYKKMPTIIGNVINKAGLYNVNRIKFISPEKGNGNGLSTIGNFNEDSKVFNDIYLVDGCVFEGYDNAIYDYGRGLISGINHCKFVDNNIAVYINSDNSNAYSDSTQNIFIDNDIAIDIENNANKNSYDFVISQNFFFNSDEKSLDYKVTNGKTYFFIKSYYGNSFDKYISNKNYRNPRVYVEGVEVVTGPLIRYPDNISVDGSSIFGFNTRANACNKLNDSESLKVHVEELTDLDNNVEIGIFDKDSQSDKGALVFGGNK